jgi:hypothetical protein
MSMRMFTSIRFSGYVGRVGIDSPSSLTSCLMSTDGRPYILHGLVDASIHHYLRVRFGLPALLALVLGLARTAAADIATSVVKPLTGARDPANLDPGNPNRVIRALLGLNRNGLSALLGHDGLLVVR